MKRYYYTDPLAAAWMARHYGMMFGIRHYEKIIWDCEAQGMSGDWHPIKDWEHIAADAADGNAQPAYYIHPDSLHLLEPQVGDLVRWGYNRKDVCEGVFTWSSSADLHSDNWGQVFQRNGIAFHWPESEEA